MRDMLGLLVMAVVLQLGSPIVQFQQAALEDPCLRALRGERDLGDGLAEGSAPLRTGCSPVCGAGTGRGARVFWGALCRACCVTLSAFGSGGSGGFNGANDPVHRVDPRTEVMIEASSRVLSSISGDPAESIQRWVQDPKKYSDNLSKLASRLAVHSGGRGGLNRDYWFRVLSTAKENADLLFRESLALRANAGSSALEEISPALVPQLPDDSKEAILETAANILAFQTKMPIEEMRKMLQDPDTERATVSRVAASLAGTLGTRDHWEAVLSSSQVRPFSLLREMLALRAFVQQGGRANTRPPPSAGTTDLVPTSTSAKIAGRSYL